MPKLKKLKLIATVFIVLALFLIFAASPGYAQITDWESYRDPNRATVWGGSGTEYNNQYNVVYMSGSGFTNPPTNGYKVGYYDGNDALTATDASPTITNDTLESSYALKHGDAYGTWHAVVFDTTGSIPDDYTNATSDDAYVDFADDAFWVAASAIPEFPTVIAMIVALGLSLGIYYWMRKKHQRQVATVSARR